jgi:hypothetical protein
LSSCREEHRRSEQQRKRAGSDTGVAAVGVRTNLFQVLVEEEDADVKALLIDATRVERVFSRVR